MSLLGEIKRRKVFQVAAVYAVAAWLSIQIVDVIGEPLNLPDWFDTFVIVLFAVGFPIAVILAWAFDLTPEGIKTDSAARVNAIPAQLGGQRLNSVLQSLVLLAVGFLVVDQYLLGRAGDPTSASSENSFTGPLQVTRFVYELPDGQTFGNLGQSALALSPDGSRFVYSASDGLYLRSMSELESQLLVATEAGGSGLVFSPDAEAVAYRDRATRQLKRVSISGGAPVVITDEINSSFGASWTAAGTVLFAQLEGIYQVSALRDAPPELIIPTGPGEQASYPSLLPDGDSVLFSITAPGDWGSGEIVAESLSTGERHLLVAGGTNAKYLPTGHLVYAFENALFGVAFDLDTFTVSGGVVSLAEGVYRAAQAWQSGVAQFDVSDNGTLAYITPSPAARSTLVWVDRNGDESPIPIVPSNYQFPRISPDGRRVAIDDRNADNDIWIWDLANETRIRLTLGAGGGDMPVWTPDGTHIAYHPAVGEVINWQASNNVGSPERLVIGERPQSGAFHPEAFSPSGELLFAGSGSSGTFGDIGMFSTDGDAEAIWVLRGPYRERNAHVSSDGRWIAYQSDESGRNEVYVRPFPDVDRDRWPVSNGGGATPLWSPDGQEIFYIEPGSPDQLISVSVEATETSFSLGARTPLLDWPYRFTDGARTYDVSSDGQRFLAIKDGGNETRTRQIIVVQNWFSELNRLAPPAE